ncbi:unnamed protein product [Orchesella dallaii]|uniref:Alpha-carbonic anhydrase domain-containing protein n=1 Tax=Orchesella dallaii TaxID=48710 RepID=A0ABP1Q2I7_9HEXA
MYHFITLFLILTVIGSVYLHGASNSTQRQLDDYDKDVLATINYFKRSNLKGRHHLKKRSLIDALAEAQIMDELESQDDNPDWQKFLIERRKKRLTSKIVIPNVGQSNNSVKEQSILVPTKDTTLEIRYLVEPEILDPIMKHYRLYDAHSFYPPWTFFGFSAPPEWHLVPIVYFTRPTKINSKLSFSPLDLRKHRSSMFLCTPEVTSVLANYDKTKTCQNVLETECDSIYPSPINILTKEVVEDETLEEFYFLNYELFYGFDMFFPADGTDLLNVKLLTPKGIISKKPSITKGSLSPGTELSLDRILIHLGENRFNGSEHLVDGKQYGMELEFFFTNKGVPYWEALAIDKMLEVGGPDIGKNVHILSIMVQATDYGVTTPPPGAEFSKAMELLAEVARMFWDTKNKKKYRAAQVRRKLTSMSSFFNVPVTGGFYTYEGSMSHPPCLTGARRSIFPKPIWITYDTWMAFVFMHSEFSDSNFLAGNFRPLEYILFQADYPTFMLMRGVQGDDFIDTGRNGIGTKPGMRTLKYKHYEKYFSRLVRKNKQISKDSRDDEYDYFEALLHNRTGNGVVHLVSPQLLCYASFITVFFNR